METTIIALENTHVGNDNKQQMMTSLEIAEVTGKPHNDLMKAIRKMEPAWEKVQGCKFALLQRTLRTLSALSNFFSLFACKKAGKCVFLHTGLSKKTVECAPKEQNLLFLLTL